MANPAIIVEFLADTAKLVAGVKDVEKSGEKASGALGNVNWRSVAKWTAVAGAAAGTAKLLKSSSDATVDLAKATGQLQRATDLDARTASAWVEVLRVRNISVDAFQTSLVKTSKLMDKSATAQAEAARATRDYNEASARLTPIIEKGGEAGKEATKELNKWGNAADHAVRAADKANAPFTRLGINLKDVREGNIQQVLLQAADGFAKIKNPATRTALAVQLFGRQGLKLLPILLKGSKGVQEMLKHVEKLGATIGDKTVKNVADLTSAQRDLNTIQQGIKVQVGSALIPAQVELYGWLLKLLNVIIPLTDNSEVMKGVLIAVAVAMGVFKVATIATTLAEAGLTAANIKAAASWILQAVGINVMNVSLGVALLTFGAIILGIAAVIAIGVLLYKNWDKISKVAGTVWAAIKKAAQATFDWLKRNWPYILGILIGPFGLAIAAIYKNWDKITAAFQAGFNAVKNAINSAKQTVVGWGSNLGGWIKSGLSSALTGIGAAAWGVVNNVGAVIAQYIGRIRGWGETIGNGIKAGFKSSIDGLAALFKAALNAVLKLWNKLQIPGFKIKGPGPLPDIKFPAVKFPNIPLLAQGGIVTGPTLAMLGERGPEAVIPLGHGGAPAVEVRVFLGETELRGMVRSEVRTENNRTAQVLLGGLS